MNEDMKEEDRAIKFSEVHPSPDSVKAVSQYYRIRIINMIPVAISVILTIILIGLTSSLNNMVAGTIIVFVSLIIGIPVIFIPLNLIISHNSYGKIWYDYFEWYELEVAQYIGSPNFVEIVQDKYFKEADYESKYLNKETKKLYNLEIIKIVLAAIFLVIGLILYIYLMFSTDVSFLILTLIMIAFGGICVYIISDATLEIRRIKVLGNKSNE